MFCWIDVCVPHVFSALGGQWSSGTGDTDSCEIPCGCWEWNLGPLNGQPLLTTCECSLQYLVFFTCGLFTFEKKIFPSFILQINVFHLFIYFEITACYILRTIILLPQAFALGRTGEYQHTLCLKGRAIMTCECFDPNVFVSTISERAPTFPERSCLALRMSDGHRILCVLCCQGAGHLLTRKWEWQSRWKALSALWLGLDLSQMRKHPQPQAFSFP